tara:strand:+ start:604 stop:996 length:393 start_codon:yes stop_codon:yes gene_type:complete
MELKMSDKIDTSGSTTFHIDYRSPPSGIGNITTKDGKNILITEIDCGPKDMDQAKQFIKEEYWPDEVIHIPIESGINWQLARSTLINVLDEQEVEYVYDSELYYELYDDYDSPNACIFTLKNWIKEHQLG